MESHRFALNLIHLRPGDVILLRGRGEIADQVRTVAGGEFTHAMLYVGDGSLIHSDIDGVHADNVQRLLFEDETDVLVRRAICAAHQQREQAITYVRRNIDVSYSVKEALKASKTGHWTDRSNRQFCSRLIAQAYQSAGVNLVPSPDYCTPNDLAQSTTLHSVNDCVHPASPEHITFALSDNPLDLQKTQTGLFFDAVRKITGEDIQKHEQLADHLIGNPHHDTSIAAAFVASGHLDLWKIDVRKNPWRYGRGPNLLPDRDQAQTLVLINDEIKSSSSMRSRFIHQYQVYSRVHHYHPREYFKAQMNLYLTLVAVHGARLITALSARNLFQGRRRKGSGSS